MADLRDDLITTMQRGLARIAHFERAPGATWRTESFVPKTQHRVCAEHAERDNLCLRCSDESVSREECRRAGGRCAYDVEVGAA